MSEKIMTLHPEEGKQGVNIDKGKYDAVRAAILDSIGDGVLPFGDLSDAVAERVPDFEGSVTWYTVSVKLDLEARGLIERVPNKSPQLLRKTESSR